MPELSVIIRTYNRRTRLRRCLEGLVRQTAAHEDFEVVVVVDGSSDGSLAMLEGLEPSFSMRVVVQENQGANIAFNRGIREATGEWCLFLDDDIEPHAGLVEAHLRVQRENDGVVGIGKLIMKIPAPSDWFHRGMVKSWEAHYQALDRRDRPPTWQDCFGGNFSAPRSALAEAGGAAEDMPRSHDVELGYRLQRAGLGFVYIPTAVGEQNERKDFRELAADYERSGEGWVRLVEKHPELLPHVFGSFHHTRLLSAGLQRFGLMLSVSPRILKRLLECVGKRDYRAFHFLRNYSYWRGVKRAIESRDQWKRLTGGTRILMYRGFSADPADAGRSLVAGKRLREQLTWLQRFGFKVLSLEEYLEIRRANELPPARAVVITIDDGYRDVLTVAAPILASHDVPATVFLVSDRIGGANDWGQDSELRGRPLVFSEDLGILAEHGLTFGAHTRTHPDLTSLDPTKVRAEIEGGKRKLSALVGYEVRTFAYPYGAVSDPVRDVAEEVGFLGSCGIESGLNTVSTPLHELRRIEVFGTDNLFRFLAKVWFGRTFSLGLDFGSRSAENEARSFGRRLPHTWGRGTTADKADDRGPRLAP